MKAGPGTTILPTGKTNDLPLMTSANHTTEMTVKAKDDLIQISIIIHMENADVDVVVVVVVAEIAALSEVATEVVAAEADLLETRTLAGATLSASEAFLIGTTTTTATTTTATMGGRNKKKKDVPSQAEYIAEYTCATNLTTCEN